MPRRESPLRLELSVDEFDAKQVAELARDPSITTAPVMPVELIAPLAITVLPNDVDALDPVAWGLDTIGATKSLLDGSGVVVGLLDTGVDSAHPAFSGVQLEECDFTGEGPGDSSGHGTHCAGTFFVWRIGNAVGGRRYLYRIVRFHFEPTYITGVDLAGPLLS
jgi:subtilisin family serine protease